MAYSDECWKTKAKVGKLCHWRQFVRPAWLQNSIPSLASATHIIPIMLRTNDHTQRMLAPIKACSGRLYFYQPMMRMAPFSSDGWSSLSRDLRNSFHSIFLSLSAAISSCSVEPFDSCLNTIWLAATMDSFIFSFRVTLLPVLTFYSTTPASQEQPLQGIFPRFTHTTNHNDKKPWEHSNN